MTEADLAEIESRLSTATITNIGGPDPAGRYPFADPLHGDAQRLLGEVRRLRESERAMNHNFGRVFDDLGELLEALGKPNVARPESPHVVIQECIEDVRRLRAR